VAQPRSCDHSVMRWSLVAALACFVSMVIWAPAAVADVVGGNPLKCPPGSRQAADHCGQWCAPTQCTSDADCTPRRRGKEKPQPLTCRSVGLCVEIHSYESCSGWSMGKDQKRSVARDVCNKASDCIRPAECETVKRCVPARPPPPPPPPPAPAQTKPASGNCSCELPGARGAGEGGHGLIWLLLATVIGLVCRARSS